MKIAVVLYSLGGPDSLTAVKPFLQNLFSDKAILSLPAFLRLPLARFIAGKREEEAKHIYAAIGGKTPLLENTKAQADALEKFLNNHATTQPGNHATFKTFIIMRYWHPRADAVVKDIAAFAPDKIVELPLYPQFSTTTTQSSFDELHEVSGKRYEAGGNSSHLLPQASYLKICCYPTLSGFIEAQVALIHPIYDAVQKEAASKGCVKPPRILFSAHGLPEKTIRAGDPYQMQCAMTVEALVEKISIKNLDYLNTYQSRVGPLKWISPYTDAEIERAGTEGVPVLVVPIAFVSEHSETLYEIEQQYRELAAEKGVPAFGRVPAVGAHPAFIAGLAGLVREALTDGKECASDGGKRICGPEWKKCPCRLAA